MAGTGDAAAATRLREPPLVRTEAVRLHGGLATGIALELPNTRLLAIYTQRGYIMCGLLNVPELDRLHPERKIVAARCIGVREIEDLLDAKIVEATREAQRLGIEEGMSGKEALERMA